MVGATSMGLIQLLKTAAKLQNAVDRPTMAIATVTMKRVVWLWAALTTSGRATTNSLKIVMGGRPFSKLTRLEVATA
jgi:hypothetical protein